jgi:hypothetical protein
MNKRTFTFACLLLAAPLVAAEITPVGQHRSDEAHRTYLATLKCLATAAPARRVRPDLWARADAARPADLASRLTARDPRLAALARLEVQLRWAAHEDAQRGWRAARSFVQLAEQFARAVAAPSAP